MSTLRDILTDTEKRIKRRPLFEDVEVFQRKEQEGETAPFCVYLYPEDVFALDSEYPVDFRTYRMNCLVKFQLTAMKGYMSSENDRHAADDLRFELVDDVLDYVSEFNTGEQGGDAYSLDAQDIDLDFIPSEAIKKGDKPDTYRFAVVLNFHTCQEREL